MFQKEIPHTLLLKSLNAEFETHEDYFGQLDYDINIRLSYVTLSFLYNNYLYECMALSAENVKFTRTPSVYLVCTFSCCSPITVGVEWIEDNETYSLVFRLTRLSAIFVFD